MNKKLNCILLVDDDEPTNYLHELAVMESGCAETVKSVQSGQAALDYLQSKEDGEHPRPDVIFLDINMPAMNGWEFLEEYKKLDAGQQGGVVVIMLTTSLNPDDEQNATGINEVSDFKHKPLTVQMIHEVVEKHFPGNL